MMYFFLNSSLFSVLQSPLIRIVELCHESPVIVYFACVTEFYVIFYYRCIFLLLKYDSFKEMNICSRRIEKLPKPLNYALCSEADYSKISRSHYK